MIQFLPEVLSIIMTIIVSSIGWSIRRGVFDRIDTLTTQIQALKEEILRDYVRKEDFVENRESHEKIWLEINSVKNLTAKIEERVEDMRRKT